MPKFQPRVVLGEDLICVEVAARNFVTLMREFRPVDVDNPHNNSGEWIAFVCSSPDMGAQLNVAMRELETAIGRVPSLTAVPPRPG
jgi:hypothetical protein